MTLRTFTVTWCNCREREREIGTRRGRGHKYTVQYYCDSESSLHALIPEEALNGDSLCGGVVVSGIKIIHKLGTYLSN